MGTINWSAIISGIALVAAVISPILTAIINNRHEIKMYNQRYYKEHRADVIENYIRYTGSISKHSATSEDFRQYGKYSKEIYLYLPDDLWCTIDSIHDCISNSEYNHASDFLAILCKELNKNPPRSVKRNRNPKNK